MGPIKNPCCGEAKRRERAGGGKKKGKRRIDVRNRRKGGEGGREGEEGEGEERASRARRVALALSLCFSKLGTLFQVLSINDRPVRFANKFTIDPRTRITFQREK